MRTSRFESADGRRWEVRSSRVRLPPWRPIDVGGEQTGMFTPDLATIVLNLVVLPFTLLLIPLALAIVELPFAVARSLLSGDVWVEAVSYYPTETRYVWRTTRSDATLVHAAVAGSISVGEHPSPPRAELVQRP